MNSAYSACPAQQSIHTSGMGGGQFQLRAKIPMFYSSLLDEITESMIDLDRSFFQELH
jgi:hypothetical protein